MGLSTKTANDHRDDRWTCPACFEDMPNGSPGVVVCSCGATVRCTVETFESSVAVIVGSKDDSGDTSHAEDPDCDR